MSFFLSRLRFLFRSPRPLPTELRGYLVHLYMDIAWYGLLAGTTIAFQGVYAARQGASPQQIGLLSAIPALVSLLFSLPMGGWLSKRTIGKAVFWSAVLQRVFYLLFVLMPSVLAPGAQVWLMIALSFIMTIPGTGLTVGFNALFAELVPLEWRGQVVGLRLAILAMVTTLSSFIAGYLLEAFPFPSGYQIVFALGVVGALMSTLHVYFFMNVGARPEESRLPLPPERSENHRLRQEIQLLYRQGLQNLRFDVLSGYFARIMGLMFFWHFAQFLVIPTVTPYTVNILKISDQTIGVATGIFNLMTFLGSLWLGQVIARWGNKKVTGFGLMGVSSFPLLMSMARGPGLYITAHLIGGIAWSMAGGALINYVLENVPAHDRPAYLAWYSVISNAAILAGSLTGPAVAAQIGFETALAIYAGMRFLAGAAVLKWG